jgi:predicted Fe-S protein YdhL (DUF1289 family)
MQKILKDPLISPCIRNCQLDDNDICIGCHRSLDEVKSWRLDSIERRHEILLNADQRRAKRPQRLPKYR